MIVKTRGIVLHTSKYSDTSIVAHVYTEQLGRCPLMVQGIRTPRSKVKMSMFLPLTLLELEISHSPRRELQRVKDITVSLPLVNIPASVSKSAIALFLGDILNRVLGEESPNEQLFNYLYQAVKLLEIITQGVADFHIIFLANLTKHLGFFPENNYSASQPHFEGRSGVFVAHKTQHNLDEAQSRLFASLLDTGFSAIGTLQLSKDSRGLFLSIMIDFYALHIPSARNIHSLDVLHDIFE